MSTWRRLEETRDLATVVVMERAGELASPPGPGWKVEHVVMPTVNVSSSAIRENLLANKSIAAMVPEAVATMITARDLYDVTR
jgi:nicotinate-nucleotide adenylyltransferase